MHINSSSGLRVACCAKTDKHGETRSGACRLVVDIAQNVLTNVPCDGNFVKYDFIRRWMCLDGLDPTNVFITFDIYLACLH